MKNNDFKRKAGLKEVLDEASPDQIESFIEKNKNSGVSDETLENIKTKVFQKTGIENVDTKEERLKSIVGKNKKTYIRRWTYAAVILLAVAVAFGIKHFNFGNPPVTNSEEQSTDIFSKDNSTNSENSNEILSEDISDNTPDNFEIKGINWATTSDVTWREEYLNVVNSLLWSGDKKQFAWAKVILEKLTPLGVSERENNSPLYQSIAEIKIITIYDLGDVSVSVKEGDTLEILVDWIVKDGKVFLSQYDLLKNDEKEIYCLPMTEIGQEYVISLLEIDNKNTLEILENNYPEVGTRLGSFTSYPMFSVDFSEIKGLNEYKITATWPFMYTTIYEWYIKDKVSTESIETKLYEFFDFGLIVPENPREKSVKDE